MDDRKGIIEFYAVNDQRKTAIKKGYSLRVRRLPLVSARELTLHVEQDSHIDHARVEYIMASVSKQIKEMVLNGHKVELGSLGVIGLSCKGSGSRKESDVNARQNVKGLQITFRPSVYLKEQMAQVEMRLTRPYDTGDTQFDEHGAVLLTDK